MKSLDSHPSGTMQRRSFSHKRVDSFHSFTTPKTKSAPIKNEWGENFIMDRCGLPCVPSLKGRENVQFVSLQHNLICRIDSLSSFRMLKVLNLYDNKIERISGLDTLASLRVLMLGKNRLKTTEGLESLQSLDILDLHGNQITALTGMSRLRTLRVLNLAANSLKKLPSLDGLLALEELNAKRNRICKIVPEVAHAKRLERLYLSNNELRRWKTPPTKKEVGANDITTVI
ncbi:leucine-rich repeat-containing protein 49-like [Daphnia pulex]|uniref:leucine-rich repeat-containing protein 49-like n=1 Tax=Daphnia pulex TaxID=6669 RepID=UPI001EE08C55|nr:leucine-rich repeat-containing protein 49-like [Daphnia pulex]